MLHNQEKKISQSIQSHPQMTEFYAEVVQRFEGNTDMMRRIMKSIFFFQKRNWTSTYKKIQPSEKKRKWMRWITRCSQWRDKIDKWMTVLESVPNEINRGSWKKKRHLINELSGCLEHGLRVWFEECLQKGSASKATQIRNYFNALTIKSITKSNPRALR